LHSNLRRRVRLVRTPPVSLSVCMSVSQCVYMALYVRRVCERAHTSTHTHRERVRERERERRREGERESVRERERERDVPVLDPLFGLETMALATFVSAPGTCWDLPVALAAIPA
jgi:hypothetical protein